MKRGFTLVEMLVVIGIIAILAGALAAGYSGATKTAKKTRGQELVSNVATSLAAIYQQNGRWPKPLYDWNGKDGWRMGAVPGAMLARHGGFSLSYVNENGAYKLTGQDKCGVLDPWGQDVMKANKNATLSTKVPSGGKIEDHVVRYAIDTEGNGFVEAEVCGKRVKVRASAIAWCCGPDGVFQPYDQLGRSDDIVSFSMGQVVQ